MNKILFEWDDNKDKINRSKHKVSFYEAQYVFTDPKRVIARDRKHSKDEDRLYCIGSVKSEILTVCFTNRENTIRIISAGYWRKGRKTYEEKNQIR